MQEHDVVILKEETRDISKGEKGTIVHVYNKWACEVEFNNEEEPILKTLLFEEIELAPKT